MDNGDIFILFLNTVCEAGMKPLIKLKIVVISGQKRLAFGLKANDTLTMRLQNIKGWCWDEAIGVWHIPYYDNHLTYLHKHFGTQADFQHVDADSTKQPGPSHLNR